MQPKRWHSAYEQGVPASLDYSEATVMSFLDHAAADFPTRLAIVFESSRLNYAQLYESTNRLASGLCELGVTRDSKVAIMLPNIPQTIIAYYAVLKLGAQVVMTNPLCVAREIWEQWTEANVVAAIVGDWLYASFLGDMPSSLGVKHFVVTGVADMLPFPRDFLAPLVLRRQGLSANVRFGKGVHNFKALLRRSPPKSPRVEVALNDLALLQYTGGTTGRPQAAMLSHRNISYNAQQTAAWFPTLKRGEDVWLSCLPFFHAFGMTVSMNWPVKQAATMVLMSNPRDIPKMLTNISKHHVTVFPALPALFNAINNHPGVESIDLTSIRGCFSGSAPLPLDVLKRFEELTGAKIVEGFGLTETSPVTHCNPVHGKRKPGTVGIPLPDTDARVVDPANGVDELAIGQIGELIVSGPQVMQGYWHRPDQNGRILRGGWLRTGDLAKMDAEGYFKIVGRKKDLIIASGYNIYPDEIDRVLLKHFAVLEAATIGVPDAKRGEAVKSFCVLKSGCSISEIELIEHCRKLLAAYKVPKCIEFREELPKSSVQKILRAQLREEENCAITA